jgi:hypothetical protein
MDFTAIPLTRFMALRQRKHRNKRYLFVLIYDEFIISALEIILKISAASSRPSSRCRCELFVRKPTNCCRTYLQERIT